MNPKILLAALFPILLTACNTNKVTTSSKPALTTETLQLSTDTLFNYKRSGLEDILPEGKRELDQIIANIQAGYVSVSSIDIIGHTDRIGSHSYNQTLGMNRALTVQNYFRANNITSEITAASLGETQPRTNNCSDQLGRIELQACLQPDRRVTINVSGVRKTTPN